MPIAGARAMDSADILNTIYEQVQTEDLKDDEEPTSFSCCWKRSEMWCIMRHEHHAGSMRDLIDQHMTRKVNRNMLVNVLKRILDRL